jgi:hypothetical protein
MKLASLLPVILFSAASLHAQYTPPNQDANQSFGVAGMEGLGTGSSPADQKLAAAAQKLTADLEHAVSRCPIAMEARQGGGLHMLRAKDGKPSAPALTPTLTLRDKKRIVSANVTAHGYAAAHGAVPLETSGPDESPDGRIHLHSDATTSRPDDNFVQGPGNRPRITSTLTVQLGHEDTGEDSAELRLPGFASLSTIQLNSVTYSDGTIWNIPALYGCSAAPSPLMLVSATH